MQKEALLPQSAHAFEGFFFGNSNLWLIVCMNISLSFPHAHDAVLTSDHAESQTLDFETLVEDYYASLYRFALSLSRNEADAFDLTQQTFYLWATKGHQLHDLSKAKSWLFTTLHRKFLTLSRHETRFPHHEIDSVNAELPNLTPSTVAQMDGAVVIQSLMQVEELYRVPLTLFYLEDHSYQEMAKILEVPIGTIMSRLSRGKQQLRQILADPNKNTEKKTL